MYTTASTASARVSRSARPGFGSLRRALIGVTAAVMIGFIGASGAAAHDSLIGTAPEEGAVIETAPEAITITLSETPLESSELELSQVQITGPDGTPVDAPVTLEENVMTAPATIEAPGVYSVAWRTVSSDGHPIEGVFEFTYEPASTIPAEDPSTASPSVQATESAEPSVTADAAPSPSEEDSVAEPASEEAGSSGGVNWLLLIVIAVIVVGGAAAFMMGHRQAVKADARENGTEG